GGGQAGGHDCVVTCVSSGFGNKTFLSTGVDGRAFLWDIERQQVIKGFPRHRGQLRTCLLLDGVVDQPSNVHRTFNPSGGRSSGLSGDGRNLQRSQGTSYAPSGATSFYSHVAVVAGDDRVVRVFDVRLNNRHGCIQDMRDAKDSITGLLSTGDSLLACSADGCVYEYDIRQGRLHTDEIFQPITSMCLSRDGQSLLLSCSDGLIRLQERSTGEVLFGLSGHSQTQNYRLEVQFALLDLSGLGDRGHSERSSIVRSAGRPLPNRLKEEHSVTNNDSDGDSGHLNDTLPDYRMCVLSGSDDGALVGWDLQRAAVSAADGANGTDDCLVIRRMVHGSSANTFGKVAAEEATRSDLRRAVALLCLQVEEERGWLIAGASDGGINVWSKC
ncbi:wd g-beta repeat-containing protein, partial [Cystoisospora suis]